MKRENKRLLIGLLAAVVCWYSFVFFLPKLDCGPPALLPYKVHYMLCNHAREVCAGQSEFGSKSSLVLKHIEQLRDQENNYILVRFPTQDSTTAAVAAYPQKKKAYRYDLLSRLLTLDWEIQTQMSYVLTVGGDLYTNNGVEFEFDAQNPITEEMLPANKPQAWTFVRQMSVLPPCN